MKPSMNRDLLPPEEPEDPFWEHLGEAFPALVDDWVMVGSKQWKKQWRALFQWCRDYGHSEGEDAVLVSQAEEEVARDLKRAWDLEKNKREKHLEIQRQRWMDEPGKE